MPEQPCEHVSEEDLTEYARDNLTATRKAQITAHLRNCALCRYELDDIRAFILCIQHAVRYLDTNALDCTHNTREGPIRVRSFRLDGHWNAEVAGEVVATGLTDCAQANQVAMDRFSALFPDHACSAACRIERSDAATATAAL